MHLNYPVDMSVRIGMVVEQMWQPVPGGSGRYIVEVASRLASQGVRAVGIAARHGRNEASPQQVGLSIPVLNSALPRRALYAAWDRLATPSADRMLGVRSGRGAQVLHATTWAIPPTSLPLAVTVHDVAFLRDASHFTAHGAAYFNRALDITKRRADAVIVPSEATARDCIEAGIDEELITVIPHGLTHTPVTDSQVEGFRARHGLTRPYGGTFFVFSDFMRGAVRLAALMDLPVTYVWTHDSIGVGEDGPTHQPIEHLASYRAIPNLAVVRPADAAETAASWKAILEQSHPAAIILSRQNLPNPARGEGTGLATTEDLARGAYVLADTEGTPDVILLASGSEVSVALEAREALAADGIAARVVSVPCLDWFEAQDREYRDSVLPPSVRARVSVEAGIALPWYRWIGDAGRAVSIEHFGASAPGELLFKEYGIDAQHVAAAAKESIEAARS